MPELERAAEVRLSGAEALRRAAGRFPLLLYLGAIVLITVIIAGGLLAQALCRRDAAGLGVLVPIGVLSLLAASQLAVALVNWLATLLVTPHPLPRMDFSEGIPPQSRTLVVVPTMLTSAPGVEDLVEALEVRFLANRDECLHFGLLTDFRDAQQESLPEDEPLVRLAPDEDRRAEREVRRWTGTEPGATSSSSSIARGAGTRRNGSGWATSASAASWRT